MTTRRELLLVLGAAPLCAALPAFAQQPGKVWRIGFLQPLPSENDPRFEAFKQRLRELGHVEGKTVTFEYRAAEANYERLPALAAELVGRKVDIILADSGTPATLAAKNATRTIPIVFMGVADPVGQGIVASLARPGGNVTGMSVQHPESAAKALALLKEVVPSAKRIAILSNPTNSSLPLVIKDMQTAARVLRLETTVVNAGRPDEFDDAFAEIARHRPAGLAILADALFNSESGRLAALAAKHRLPAIGGMNLYPENGGLMSYGADRLALIRRSADLVDKILKGAKPGDLPVEQPTKFDLIVNLKAAKALGLTIPQSILVRADRVIE